MKLVNVTKSSMVRFKYKYSVWLNPDAPVLERIIYATDSSLDFKLLLKLNNIVGSLYIQKESAGHGNAYLGDYDELYKEFVK